MDAELLARLDAMDRKLDYIVERQRYTEDFIREMTPVGREAMNALAVRLTGLEKRGWFDIGAELIDLVDGLADTYGPQDVRELSEALVGILDTLRNVAQPDMLELANEATDVLHDVDHIRPVGPFKAVAAVREQEVQKGLGVALEILRHIGRAQGAPGPAKPRRATPKAAASEKRVRPAPNVPPAAPAQPSEPPAPATASEVVEWEGRRFCSEGFLLDTADWDEALATKMAAGLGLTLTPDHWKVIVFARKDFLATGASPNVRRLASGSGVGIRRMYELFPTTPGKAAAMVAGIPKPAGCV